MVLLGPDAHGYARPAIVAVPAVRAACNVQLKRELAAKSKLSSASLDSALIEAIAIDQRKTKIH